MKNAEIKSMSKEVILDNVNNFKKEVMNLRFNKAAGDLKNTARISIVKKTIARLLTKLNQQ